LLAEFKPFVTHLTSVEQLSASSINRHLRYLLLLGGGLISQINYFEQKRRVSPPSCSIKASTKKADRSVATWPTTTTLTTI